MACPPQCRLCNWLPDRDLQVKIFPGSCKSGLGVLRKRVVCLRETVVLQDLHHRSPSPHPYGEHVQHSRTTLPACTDSLKAYYTQNVGTPCLEYMLSADAVRLAYAKGLHRAVPSSQGLSMQDAQQRSCIFWSLYCLEKQIASQASRPSVGTQKHPFTRRIKLFD